MIDTISCIYYPELAISWGFLMGGLTFFVLDHWLIPLGERLLRPKKVKR